MKDMTTGNSATYWSVDVTEIRIVEDKFRADVVVMQARAAIREERFGAIDIETTIVEDPFVELPELISVAVTFDGEVAYVFDPKWWKYARRHLSEASWIMHNGLFDAQMLRLFDQDLQLRTDWTVSHDTMALAYLLGDYESKSLESLSETVLGLEPYKNVDYKNIKDEPFEKVAQMNGDDVLRTFNLFRPLADRLNDDPQLLRIYKWLLMPACRALMDVTRNGVPVDVSHLAKISEKILADFEFQNLRLAELTPSPYPENYPDGWPKGEFNPRSYMQVGHVLFDVFGMYPVKITDSGNRSTDEDTLTQLLLQATGEEEVWIDTLLKHRTLSKQVSSYIEAWPRFIDESNKMHPWFKPLHVVTGRLSSERPNIQQVPREKEFRNVFGGQGTWVKADYSQIELRIASWVAQEEKMMEAYRDGLDLHSLTAKLVLGDESSSARQVGKTLNFGLLYGAGVGTLRRVARMDYGIDLTEAQASAYRDQFFKTYPALKRWHKESEIIIKNTHHVRSPLGRIRHLPNAADFWDEGRVWAAVREGINMPIQSFASDLLLMALVRLNEKFPGHIVAAVHDEIDFVFPSDMSVPYDTIRETMEDVSWLQKFGINLPIPVVVDIESGTHWGEIS